MDINRYFWILSASFRLSEQIERGWHCSGRSAGDYCVYSRSLCFTRDDTLILLTDNKNLIGKSKSLAHTNKQLFTSPLNLPDIRNLSNEVGVPSRSYFKEISYRENMPNNSITLDGINFLAKFDEYSYNYNFYHWINTVHVGFLARYYEKLGIGNDGNSINSFITNLLTLNSTSQYTRALLCMIIPTLIPTL